MLKMFPSNISFLSASSLLFPPPSTFREMKQAHGHDICSCPAICLTWLPINLARSDVITVLRGTMNFLGFRVLLAMVHPSTLSLAHRAPIARRCRRCRRRRQGGFSFKAGSASAWSLDFSASSGRQSPWLLSSALLQILSVSDKLTRQKTLVQPATNHDIDLDGTTGSLSDGWYTYRDFRGAGKSEKELEWEWCRDR